VRLVPTEQQTGCLGCLQASNPLAVPLRNLAIRAIGKLPALQQPMMRRVAGLRE
jgi:hypothetical protein